MAKNVTQNVTPHANALMEENHEEVVVWGTGTPRREFLHVDDMASACIHILNLSKPTYKACTFPMQSHINIGCGKDISILELAQMIAKVTGFKGSISTDPTKLDGAPRKLMNVSRLTSMGWQAKITLLDGISQTYSWFLQNKESLRG